MKALVILFGIFVTYSAVGAGKNPALQCLNHHYQFSVDTVSDGTKITVSSERRVPLLPSLDPRIQSVTVDPIACAQTLRGALVCFTDVCVAVHYYGFDGTELKDIEHSGDITLTALPDKGRDPKTGHYSDRLKLRLEFNDWYLGKKSVVEESFETYPGVYCQFKD